MERASSLRRGLALCSVIFCSAGGRHLKHDKRDAAKTESKATRPIGSGCRAVQKVCSQISWAALWSLWSLWSLTQRNSRPFGPQPANTAGLCAIDCRFGGSRWLGCLGAMASLTWSAPGSLSSARIRKNSESTSKGDAAGCWMSK